MKKLIITEVLIILFLCILLAYLLNNRFKYIKSNYSGYDTSIVYKNNKWDTIITKKTLPSWLK